MSNWNNYNNLLRYQDLGFSLDLSRTDMEQSYITDLQPQIDKAYADLVKTEAGEIVNPDEGRMVGHYWLRDETLAPNAEIKAQITEPIAQLKQLAEDVHHGVVAPPSGGRFENLLIIISLIILIQKVVMTHSKKSIVLVA